MSTTENPDRSSIIVFLRHGESTANAENRHQGQVDFALSDLGRRQVELLREYWSKHRISFDLAISSPLIRAKESVEIITAGTGTKVVYHPVWMERDNGRLAGLLFEEAQEILPPPDFIPLYQPIASTGESQWELYLRAGQALNQLMKHPPGRYLVVSHGALLNMVMHALVGLVPQPNFQGAHFRFSNTGYTTASYLPHTSSWTVVEHNNTSHLGN